MSQQQNVPAPNQEGRIELALLAYYNRKFKSRRHAANAFNIPSLMLTNQYNGIIYLPDRRNGRYKLTMTKK